MSNYFQNQNQKQNNSAILNLESLTKQYDTTLIQYNQVQSDYINNLQNSPSSALPGQSQVQATALAQAQVQGKSDLNLVSIPNNTFWGTKGISSSNVSSVEKCSALCSITPGCSGATYNVTNNNQNNCWLRGGDGSIIAGTNKQYAIISKSKNYLQTLENLNIQLINLNNKIMQIFDTNKNVFLAQDNERNHKYAILKENYKRLEKERRNILNQLLKYQTIEEKQNQGELIVTSNYYNYILLLIIALVCMFILSKTAVILIGENVASSSISNSGLLIATILSCFVIVLLYFFLF
jgi:hypothetical protein